MKIARVLVADTTGLEKDQSRSDLLMQSLGSLGMLVEKWSGGRWDPKGLLILAHSTDLLPSMEETARQLAREGAYLIMYTGGSIEEELGGIGDGLIHSIRWETLYRAVLHLRPEVTWSSLQEAIELAHGRDRLQALFLLLWCVNALVNDKRGERRQREWKESNSKWQDVFGTRSDESLVAACGLSGGLDSDEELSEVGVLLKWMWAEEPHSQPDFTCALQQLRKRFGLSL